MNLVSYPFFSCDSQGASSEFSLFSEKTQGVTLGNDRNRLCGNFQFPQHDPVLGWGHPLSNFNTIGVEASFQIEKTGSQNTTQGPQEHSILLDSTISASKGQLLKREWLNCIELHHTDVGVGVAADLAPALVGPL